MAKDTLTRDDLVARNARFYSAAELKEKGVSTGTLEADLWFGCHEDAADALKRAGFEVAEDEVIVWCRNERQLFEIAIVKKQPVESK